jgi:hypothetical protein
MSTAILDANGLGDVKRQETKSMDESIEKAAGFAPAGPSGPFDQREFYGLLYSVHKSWQL